eukprot:152027_1
MDPNTPPNDKQPPLSDPQNVAGAMTPEFSPGGDLPVSGLNDGQHDDGFPKMDAEQSMTGFAANDFFENDQYTMKFLTVKGVRFEVHYLLMVVAFSGFDILFEARGRGIHVYSRVLMVPIVAVGMVFSVLGHELAHIIVMMGSGYMFEKAILLPLGGTVCLRVEASRLTQVMVAAAGPAFNVVLAVVCALLGKVFGTDDFVGNSFKIISAFNVSMAYWNLTMPVHPLDFSSITTAYLMDYFSLEGTAHILIIWSGVSLILGFAVGALNEFYSVGFLMFLWALYEAFRTYSCIRNNTYHKHPLLAEYGSQL